VTQPAVGKVVHLVGVVTDDVFSFLSSASSALAKVEVEQSIVFVNSMQLQSVLPRVHASVRVVVTPPTRNPLRRWLWALRAFRRELREGPTQGVHLYGRVPGWIGAWAARREGVAIALRYSPHGASFSSVETLLREVARPEGLQVARVERPVNADFFSMHRNEARHPLVVTGSHLSNPRSADLLAQLAVLLGGEDLGLAFNWVGVVDEEVRLRLKAAQVGVFSAKSVGEWASRLAAGWVYLAPGGDPGFPSLLVEAMALGLPCVAVDTPQHRDLIRHGENGYLCRTEEEIVNCIAPLIDSQELRRRIGQAAREGAEQRFGEARFRDALFAAYQLPHKTPETA
jgi:glycosyltransferase involved in cell wall biosynthesis